jgi:hypothetical protein
MKKLLPFILAAVLIGLITWGLSFFLPWWSFAIPALIIPLLLKLKPWQGFLAAALGVGLTWLIFILIANSANDSILAERMSLLFGLKGSVWIIITSILPGVVVSGIFGLSGGGLRTAMARKKR